MERLPMPFSGPSMRGRSTKVNASRTLNMYPVVENPGAKSQIVMYSDPGLRNIGSAGVGPCRSDGHLFNGKQHFVSGNEFVSFDAMLNTTSIGTMATSSGRVRMASNKDRTLIVDGNTGKYWDGTTFATIASANFPDDATCIDILDGYFIVNNPANPGRFYVSEDGVTWNATDFATAESVVDSLTGIMVHGNDLHLFGELSVEVWQNAGAGGGVPFRRHPSGKLPWGLVAPDSLSKSSMGSIFLANVHEGEVKVILLSGFQQEIISNEWLEWRIGQILSISNAIGFTYTQNGQWYYQLTFPSAGVTFVYLFNQKWWYERSSWDTPGQHRAVGHGFLARNHIVGDYSSGSFYVLDFDHFYDDTNPFERSRTTTAIHKTGRRMSFYGVYVEFEGGVGNTVPPGDDPVAYLRYSDDGKTWSQWLSSPIGALGEYETVAYWGQLGESRERVFEVRVTDPVNVVMLGMWAEIGLSRD